MNCLKLALELERIRFHKPVFGFVHCDDCKKDSMVNIHIEFV
jgi:hypothetical protein